MVVCVLMSTIANAPVAFLKIGELQAGEIDLVINADDDGANAYNFTKIEEIVASTERFQYNTPRIARKLKP
jgi:hypothetical protein